MSHAHNTADTPATWIETFPWLGGVIHAGDALDWHEPVAAAGRVERRQRIQSLTQHAIEHVTSWPIGELFPGLPVALLVADLDLPSRARTALDLAPGATLEQLADLSIDELLSLRSIGVGTVEGVVQALAHVSTTLATPSILRGADGDAVAATLLGDARGDAAGGDGDVGPEVDGDDLDGPLRDVAHDLRHIAEWFSAIGAVDTPLLGAAPSAPIPASVAHAHTRLTALAARDLAESGGAGPRATLRIDDALAVLDERTIDVLRRRTMADRPESLESIGASWSVTRERVRQIEGAAKAHLLSTLHGDPTLEAVVLAVREFVDPVRRLDDLVAAMPALGDTLEAIDQPVWRLLDRIDDAYEIVDGWCCSPTAKAARAATTMRLDELADEHGVVRVSDIDLFDDAASPPDAVREWMTGCRYVVVGDAVLTRTGSMGDYAAAILSLEQRPMSTDAIVARFEAPRSVRSLRNTLAGDERIVRADRDEWALATWGVDAYAGIRPAIEAAVRTANGQIGLHELIADLTSRFSVSERSIAAYAAAHPFATHRGVVTFATTARRAPRKTARETRRLYRRPSGWVFRTAVTSDHLRGSGFPAPLALAHELGIDPGTSRQLPSRLGDQTIAWTGTQPAFGTIRRFLLDLDARIDDRILLVMADSGEFDVEVVADTAGDGVRQAAALAGVDAPGLSERDALAALAASIGGHDGPSDRRGLARAFAQRGDDDIAALLAEPDSTAASP